MRGIGQHTAPAFTLPEPADNTTPFVRAQVREYERTCIVVHPEIAREIAAHFHSPSPYHRGFAAFASSGTLLAAEWPEEEQADLTPQERDRPVILDEIDREATRGDHDDSALEELSALRDYVMTACNAVARAY